MTELDIMKHAKNYLDKLAGGINPLNDCKVSGDSVLSEQRISRCLSYVSSVLQKVIDNGGEIGKKYIVQQKPFFITAEQSASVEISEEPVGISVLAKRIAAVLDEDVKPLSAVTINAWLVTQNFLQENIRAGKTQRVSTAKGHALGIETVDGVNREGISYRKNLFNADAQRFVIACLPKIAEDMQTEKTEGNL